MKILGIDTATEACSVALHIDGQLLRRYEVAGRTHASRLRSMVSEVLAEAACEPAQLDGFACGIGPGSFAGVRIGVAFVQGMAFAIDRPVVPLTSLELLALKTAGEGADIILSAIDARMGEVYFAAYRAVAGQLSTRIEPQVAAASSLRPLNFSGVFSARGSGWAIYEQSLRTTLQVDPESIDGKALPDIADGITLAHQRLLAEQGIDAGTLRPLYLRENVALTLIEQRAAKGL